MLNNSIRKVFPFKNGRLKTKYFIQLSLLIIMCIICILSLLLYNNPVAITSPSFWPIVSRRISLVIAIVIVAICHSLATIAFQTVTNNHLITPSLLGFDAVYSLIHTSTLFFLGVHSFLAFNGIGAFLVQVCLMIALCLFLYGWILWGKKGNIQLMLLVGVVLGTGLRSASGFMRRLLTPSEFDILHAKLYGSMNNADSRYFVVAIPIVIIIMLCFWLLSKKLNVISLGKDVSINLGIDFKFFSIIILILVSVLMAISTALVGSLTFYGFLVASLTYQFSRTYDHRYLFVMSVFVAILVMALAYFLMFHVFYAMGVVSIIIEFLGGSIFIIMVLKRGSL